jgi:hypothetical protein
MGTIKLPSVTQIISFVHQAAFNDVPLFYLERGQARGTAVHASAAAHLGGLWHEVTPEFGGYHKSLVNWADEFVVRVLLVEKELVDLKRGFKGHPDAIVELVGDWPDITLIDLKTPKPLSLSWRLQLAGYRLLAQANGLKVTRVASLRLDKDGGRAKFQGYTKTLAHDQNVFLSALNVWRFFNG